MSQDDLAARLSRHLADEAQVHAPDRVLLGALATIDITPQRRRLSAPWRTRPMYLLLRTGGAIGIAALVLATIVMRGPGGVPIGDVGSPSPSLAVSPVPLPTYAAAPLEETAAWNEWDSSSIGYSIRYPSDWQVLPMLEATETPSPSMAAIGLGDFSREDQFIAPQGQPQLGFVVQSQPLGPGQTFGQYLEDYAGAGRSTPTYGPMCYPEIPKWPTVTVDGVQARVGGGPAQCYFVEAVLESGGRVYHFKGIKIDPQSGFDRSTFLTLLSTIRLHPEQATEGTPPPGA
jgi:hypothetical protein